MQVGLPPEEIGYEIMKTLFTYNFYWSIIQVAVGGYAIKLMGGLPEFSNALSLRRVLHRTSSIITIISLVAFATAVIWVYQLINAFIFYGGLEEYFELWRKLVSELPLWSRLYFVLVAPFTAGIFEEAIWRWYGINRLKDYYSEKKANLIQALAFGLWHGISLYTIFTSVIGYVFGLIYLRRGELGELVVAHVLTDLIGFGLAFFIA